MYSRKAVITNGLKFACSIWEIYFWSFVEILWFRAVFCWFFSLNSSASSSLQLYIFQPRFFQSFNFDESRYKESILRGLMHTERCKKFYSYFLADSCHFLNAFVSGRLSDKLKCRTFYLNTFIHFLLSITFLRGTFKEIDISERK